jgi:hypothetical protein
MCTDSFGNPIPRTEGQVIEKPVWIRVRPEWYEKVLVVCIVLQLIATGMILLYGSPPSRSSSRNVKVNMQMTCDIIRLDHRELYDKYRTLGYCT